MTVSDEVDSHAPENSLTRDDHQIVWPVVVGQTHVLVRDGEHQMVVSGTAMGAQTGSGAKEASL